MARSYGKLLTTIWTDDDFKSLSSASQRLYMLLLAHPKMSSAGVAPLQVSRWSKMSRDATLEGTERALHELSERGYVVVDEDTDEVWLRSFIKHDKAYKNGNLLAGLRSTISRSIESAVIHRLADAELESCLLEGPSDALGTPSAGPSDALSVSTPTTTTPEPPPTMDGRSLEIVDHYVRHALETAKNIGNRVNYTRSVTDAVMANPDLQRYQELFPDAPSDAVAAWLHGDKGSMRYYKRADEMAEVIALKVAEA